MCARNAEACKLELLQHEANPQYPQQEAHCVTVELIHYFCGQNMGHAEQQLNWLGRALPETPYSF